MESNDLHHSIDLLKVEYDNESICLGKKIKNGVVTDELSVVFSLKKKNQSNFFRHQN